jgi:hypothetical protein
MPSRNVEIAQRGLEAYNRRDLSVLGELFQPDDRWRVGGGAQMACLWRLMGA